MAARRAWMAVGLAAAVAAAPAAAQVTEQMFRSGRTGELAALCGSPAADPNHTAALAWCHGFLLGAAQYHASVSGDRGAHRPLFCLPAPEPTLEQARAAFVTWARANPQHAGEKAIDGLMRAMVATYPCPAAAPRPRR